MKKIFGWICVLGFVLGVVAITIEIKANVLLPDLSVSSGFLQYSLFVSSYNGYLATVMLPF